MERRRDLLQGLAEVTLGATFSAALGLAPTRSFSSFADRPAAHGV